MFELEKMTVDRAKLLDPVTLAYIGDSIFDLYIRQRLVVNNPNLKTQKLHNMAVKYVSALSQSIIMETLEENLLEDESYFYKRGRNQKSGHLPKSVSAVDYRRATGFETLVGFLYITGQDVRLNNILAEAAEIIEELKR